MEQNHLNPRVRRQWSRFNEDRGLSLSKIHTANNSVDGYVRTLQGLNNGSPRSDTHAYDPLPGHLLTEKELKERARGDELTKVRKEYFEERMKNLEKRKMRAPLAFGSEMVNEMVPKEDRPPTLGTYNIITGMYVQPRRIASANASSSSTHSFAAPHQDRNIINWSNIFPIEERIRRRDKPLPVYTFENAALRAPDESPWTDLCRRPRRLPPKPTLADFGGSLDEILRRPRSVPKGLESKKPQFEQLSLENHRMHYELPDAELSHSQRQHQSQHQHCQSLIQQQNQYKQQNQNQQQHYNYHHHQQVEQFVDASRNDPARAYEYQWKPAQLEHFDLNSNNRNLPRYQDVQEDNDKPPHPLFQQPRHHQQQGRPVSRQRLWEKGSLHPQHPVETAEINFKAKRLDTEADIFSEEERELEGDLRKIELQLIHRAAQQAETATENNTLNDNSLSRDVTGSFGEYVSHGHKEGETSEASRNHTSPNPSRARLRGENCITSTLSLARLPQRSEHGQIKEKEDPWRSTESLSDKGSTAGLEKDKQHRMNRLEEIRALRRKRLERREQEQLEQDELELAELVKEQQEHQQGHQVDRQLEKTMLYNREEEIGGPADVQSLEVTIQSSGPLVEKIVKRLGNGIYKVII